MNKNALKSYAVWARVQLIEQVKQEAFEYGITAEGYGEENAVIIGDRALSNSEISQRSELIREIKSKGFNQVIEEVAYIWFNRFIALRYMEVNGYLPSRVRVFTNENNAFEPEILKEAVNIDLDGLDKNIVFDLIDKQDNNALYKYLLITQCNALNSLLPGMFEKISNYTEILFPNNLLRTDSVIGRMISDIPEEDWHDQMQIIGWLYQYYNIELKDETFALLKKNVKITKERIPAATQLFTPDWIVRYMVENSLGRLWYEGHPDFDKSQWKYYLNEAEQEESVKTQLDEIKAEYANIKPEEIKIIDPCMGSGHILVYAFDVLMQIYLSQGYSERDAAKSIVENNLYGIDIDDRAYQLAYFAVMMKARSYSRRILTQNVKCNLCTIVETNQFNNDYLELFGEHKDIAKKLADEFVDAKEYGSILNIKTSVDDIKLLADKLEKISNTEYDNMFDLARQSGLVTEFKPILQQALALAQKYDVVVTNPPYMGASGMSAKLSAFVKKNYLDSKSDLFAVFIERCGEMAKSNCYQAMITQHAWMFLSSYESLRSKLLMKDTINMAHLGARAFDEIAGEVVQTTTFVMRRSNLADYKGTYCRLIEPTSEKTKEDMFLSGDNQYTSKQSNFSKIPGSPIAYWVSDNFIKAFENPKLGEFARPRVGQNTGDNNRFLRLWFESDMNLVTFNLLHSELKIKKYKWLPYNKGGGFRRWYGNQEYIINWESDGKEIKDYAVIRNNGKHWSRYIQNVENMCKQGVTWTFVSSSAFSVRFLPTGFICDVAGSAVFPNDDLILYITGLLNSKYVNYTLSVINPTINYQAGNIAAIPIIIKKEKTINYIVNDNVVLSKKDWDFYETSWDFKKSPLI